MLPLWVAELLDSVEGIGPRFFARGVNMATGALALEQLEEALDPYVVMAGSPSAHAADPAVVA